ncbi:MAG: aminopeptidase [Bacteroidales bacterium]|nr:aminopeptidase [Bacteroidales bacterium]
MKNILLTIGLVLAVAFSAQAQKKDKKDSEKSVYVFTDIKVNPNTSVKDQNRSGTCWSFSGISFLESELLRMGKGEYDLSDMYPVYKCYLLKGDKYVRLHGKTELATGGASNDVADVLEEYGVVPEEVFTGLHYGADAHDHSELDAVLTNFLKGVVEGKKLTTAWRPAYKAILNTYLGEDPETFTYGGKEYTPRSFADELGLDAKKYVKLSSYTHHPYYEQFEMDVPDNWNHGMVYNLPIDEFEQVVDAAIENGYTLVWGGDVSDPGFSWKKGVAIMPDMENPDLSGTDRDKWETLSQAEKRKSAYSFERIVPEKKISQEDRQKNYDNWSATDDHGMHLVGMAKDQNGNIYYKIKNSWNVSNPYNGYLYMSKPFFRANTLDIMVNIDALPAEIRAKLGL